MKIQVKAEVLKLRHTFTIAHGSSDERVNLVVGLEHEGRVGWGLAAPNPRYGETPESCKAALLAMARELQGDPRAYEPLISSLLRNHEGEFAAKAALDMAIMDLAGKTLDAPLYRIWGLDPAGLSPTSMTIGMAAPEQVAQRAQEAAGFHVLKVKLGSADDHALIEAIRSVTQVPIRVDANEGWHSREHAIREVEWLAAHNVELVEQPMPASAIEDAVWLKQRSPLPLIADEAFTCNADLLSMGEAYHGVNIKLMKCGGTLMAREAVTLARGLGLQIMLGCMVESSLGIAAAAQLAPYADYLDLDGNLLICNDPFRGHAVIDGFLKLNDAPGLGASPLT